MVTDFCRACGASIPKRDGEGTCEKCDPEGVKKHVEDLRKQTPKYLF